MSVLSAEDISVHDGNQVILSPVSVQLTPGEPLIVLGETGSGKSLLAQAIMGSLPSELSAAGWVTVAGKRFDASLSAEFRGLWGREISILPQEPWLSLDPLMRARVQVAESHQLVRGLSRNSARSRAISDLKTLGLAESASRYPHELSGGMAQRVAIAAARAGGAAIVIADEPTKGLDADRRDQVGDLLLHEMGEHGGLLVITHDLALARRIGGRVIILRNGEVVEGGATDAVLSSSVNPYTRELIAADPHHWTRHQPVTTGGPPVVQVQDLALERGGETLFSQVDFAISPGAIFGVTGSSGCGKSSLGDAMLGLLKPLKGTVTRQQDLAATAFQKLYQDPVAAFPRNRKLGRTLTDLTRRAGCAADTIDVLLERLGLDASLLTRLPSAVSGGELQRLSLLRVLLLRPAFIFCDEPTSRLDPITQAAVISVLTDTAQREGIAMMLVSHDPALIGSTTEHSVALGT